jgi:hypothetical protein
MSLNASYDNLWQYEHSLGVQYSFTPEELKATSLHKSTFFDDPLIANYSAFYRMPVGEGDAVQELITADSLNFGYSEVTHQFRLPPAGSQPQLTFYASRSTTDTGVKFGPANLVTETAFIKIVSQDSGQDVTLNEALGAAFTLPLREIVGVKPTFSLGVDFKNFKLSSFNTNNFYITTTITNSSGSQTIENTVSSGQPPREASLQYLPLNLGLDLAIPDKLGLTLVNTRVAFNPLNPGRSSGGDSFLSGDADFGNASYSTNARASFVTLNLGVSREQKFYKDWSVLFRANGQWANTALVSNEQFAMGGTAGVRGYLDGQAYGDLGWRVQVEPRTPLVNLGLVDGTAPFWVRGSLFMDYGQLFHAEHLHGVDDHLDFWGVGAGVTGSIGNHLDARVAISWPLLDVLDAQAGRVRFYFGLGVQF